MKAMRLSCGPVQLTAISARMRRSETPRSCSSRESWHVPDRPGSRWQGGRRREVHRADPRRCLPSSQPPWHRLGIALAGIWLRPGPQTSSTPRTHERMMVACRRTRPMHRRWSRLVTRSSGTCWPGSWWRSTGAGGLGYRGSSSLEAGRSTRLSRSEQVGCSRSKNPSPTRRCRVVCEAVTASFGRSQVRSGRVDSISRRSPADPMSAAF